MTMYRDPDPEEIEEMERKERMEIKEKSSNKGIKTLKEQVMELRQKIIVEAEHELVTNLPMEEDLTKPHLILLKLIFQELRFKNELTMINMWGTNWRERVE